VSKPHKLFGRVGNGMAVAEYHDDRLETITWTEIVREPWIKLVEARAA